MPTVTDDVVTGWASCIDALCPGYKQVPAGVVRRVQEFTYFELGGDIPGIERSMIDVACFAEPDDLDCPHCGKPRVAAIQERPEYPRASGQDPLRLLNLTQTQQINDMQIAELERGKEMAELKALVAQQSAALAELTAGRRTRAPRKEDE